MALERFALTPLMNSERPPFGFLLCLYYIPRLLSTLLPSVICGIIPKHLLRHAYPEQKRYPNGKNASRSPYNIDFRTHVLPPFSLAIPHYKTVHLLCMALRTKKFSNPYALIIIAFAKITT